MSTTRTLSVELPDFVADALQNRADRWAEPEHSRSLLGRSRWLCG
jgi:hypothetical protein